MSFAWVFPGQGSQKVGMLKTLAEQHPIIEDTFHQASQAIDFDLFKCALFGPEEELNATHVTQPALLTASVALWRLWRQGEGNMPRFLAGHSLGEYSALVCAKAIAFEDAVRVVYQRGQFMQQAVAPEQGLMAAIIGLDLEAVQNVCDIASAQGVVAPANINSPIQIVIAGEKDAVLEAINEAKNAGAKRALPLQVSAPSHCDLMRPAAEQLAKVLENIDIVTPQIPVYHNVDAKRREHGDDIKVALCEQLYQPVRWVECVEALNQEGVHQFVEAGPGKVLAGLIKRIDKDASILNIDEPEGFKEALTCCS
jgi:[acyl-carrier-protein] S-malonyltransferase